MATDVEGLRTGLKEGVKPVSQLKKQASTSEIIEIENSVKSAGVRAFEETPPSIFNDGVTQIVGGFYGILSGVGLAYTGAPFIGIPLVALTLAGLSGGFVRPRWREWRARRRMRKSFKGRASRRDYLREGSEMAKLYPHWRKGEVGSFHGKTDTAWLDRKYSVVHSVNADGVGEIKWREKDRYGKNEVKGEYLFYPGANLWGVEFLHPVQLQGVNLRGADLRHLKLRDGSILDYADLREATMRCCDLRNVSLVGANLAGADLDASMLRYCDMSGVDLTGADVSMATLPLDLSDTNITREQFESLAGMGEGGTGVAYRVRELSLDDVVAAHGGDRDAVTVAMWVGDIEVRERASGRVVSGEYNPEDHYIPYWALNAS